MSEHPGYEEHDPVHRGSFRNGTRGKSVLTDAADRLISMCPGPGWHVRPEDRGQAATSPGRFSPHAPVSYLIQAHQDELGEAHQDELGGAQFLVSGWNVQGIRSGRRPTRRSGEPTLDRVTDADGPEGPPRPGSQERVHARTARTTKAPRRRLGSAKVRVRGRR